MSEQYPLLREEISDEERYGPRIQRPMKLRGRAKNHVKGAAVIMTRWPEHWTSLLTFWWIALGMITLTTFIIYNCLFSMGLSQPTNTRATKYASFKTISQIAKPGVFMHVFIDDKEEKLSRYMPHIEVFAHKYKDFKYNLIIVANDTIDETNNLTAKLNNDVALNSLWTNDVNYGHIKPKNSNVNVVYRTLSKYLDDSPIKKYWKNLPHQFIRFLVRAISVWDKGGIAVNPIILTPHSPDAAYTEKFINIIKKFKKYKTKTVPEQEQEIRIRNHGKILPKVNNIRDIINALERRDSADNPSQETLDAAESRSDSVFINAENTFVPVIRIDLTTDEKETTATTLLNRNVKPHGKLIDFSLTSTTHALVQEKNTSNEAEKSEKSSNLLSQFLNYLFVPKGTESSNHTKDSKKKRSSPLNKEIAKDEVNNPIIVNAKEIPDNRVTNSAKPTYQDHDKLYDLTLDLKGDIIATETPCHVFIGNMFTNAIHYNVAESLSSFIIKELSIFCNGRPSSCLGIDVILV